MMLNRGKSVQKIMNGNAIVFLLIIYGILLSSPIRGEVNAIKERKIEYTKGFSVPGTITDSSTKEFYTFLKQNIGNIVNIDLALSTWYSIGDVVVYCQIEYPIDFLEKTGPETPESLYYDIPLFLPDRKYSGVEIDKIENSKEPELRFQQEICDKAQIVYISIPASSLYLVQSVMASTEHRLIGKFLVSSMDKWHTLLRLTKMN